MRPVRRNEIDGWNDVIPGLVPGIHVLDERTTVDGRHKAGHDVFYLIGGLTTAADTPRGVIPTIFRKLAANADGVA